MKNLKKGFNLKKELLAKHKKGQKKYGAFSFLNDGRSMRLETADEIIDGINYLVYEELKIFFGKELIKSWDKNTFNGIYEFFIGNLLNSRVNPRNKELLALVELAKDLRK